MALTQEQIQTRIDEIEELLATGVTSLAVDGTSTSFDHDSLRKEKNLLLAKLTGGKAKRPRASRINLGGF